MTDLPIPLSAPMIRALFEDRKTQTRRLFDKLRRFGKITEFGRSTTRGYDWHFRDREMRWNDLRDQELKNALLYRVDDRLWVREQIERANGEAVGFPADRSWYPNTPWIWKRSSLPSIHMPRHLSRLTLLVTDVRVERLQEISEEDAKAEGAGLFVPGHGFISESELRTDPGYSNFLSPRLGFETIWSEIHGDGTWAANPWVVALTFEVHKANIDTLAKEAA